jgi:hypothetical protein
MSYINNPASGGGGGGSITVGGTPIVGGAANQFLADNGGTLIEWNGTQATAQLNPFSSTLQGLAPASGGGTSNFLRADGTWAAPTATLPPQAPFTVTGNPTASSAVPIGMDIVTSVNLLDLTEAWHTLCGGV